MTHQWTADETRALQGELKKQGYDLGHTGHHHDGVDGAKGPLTDGAFGDFCKKHHTKLI